MSTLCVKRVYEPPEKSDGFRVLVDRLWPRGLTKDKAKIDLWLKDISPSNELRRRFHAKPELWDDFKKAYAQELKQADAAVQVIHENWPPRPSHCSMPRVTKNTTMRSPCATGSWPPSPVRASRRFPCPPAATA